MTQQFNSDECQRDAEDALKAYKERVVLLKQMRGYLKTYATLSQGVGGTDEFSKAYTQLAEGIDDAIDSAWPELFDICEALGADNQLTIPEAKPIATAVRQPDPAIFILNSSAE